jgi:hypothetical protein
LTIAAASGANAKFLDLKSAFASKQQQLGQEFAKAKSEQERDKIKDQFYDAMAAYAMDVNKFVEENGKDPAAQQARNEIRMLVQQLGQADSPAVATALRTLIKGAADDMKGPLNLTLVQNLRGQYERAYSRKDKGAEKLLTEAEALLKQLGTDNPALAGRVKDIQFELDKLTVGRTAMDIEAEDLDGKKFKLSDYRGKVVVLDFWGHW